VRTACRRRGDPKRSSTICCRSFGLRARPSKAGPSRVPHSGERAVFRHLPSGKVGHDIRPSRQTPAAAALSCPVSPLGADGDECSRCGSSRRRLGGWPSSQASRSAKPRSCRLCSAHGHGPSKSSTISATSGGVRPPSCIRRTSAYDNLFHAAEGELDPVKRAALFIAMNDMVVERGVVIPVVCRPQVSAISKKLRATLSGWDATFWNLQDWYREA
jgi:hypothetical protein